MKLMRHHEVKLEELEKVNNMNIILLKGKR